MSDIAQNEPQKKPNLWMEHLANFKQKYPHVTYREIMKMAQDSYQKKEKPKRVPRQKKPTKIKKSQTKTSSEDELIE